MEVLETKFIFRVTVGFLHASPAVPHSGTGINQDVASDEESALTGGLLSAWEQEVVKVRKIWDSERYKKNTKRAETHDDNTDDDDDDDDNNNICTSSLKQESIANYINRHKYYARGICM